MEMGGSSNTQDVSAPTHDLKYTQALTVNVSNFVSVKLSGHSNYKIWKAQMLCLIESQLLLHIIYDDIHFPVDKGVHMIGQYDKLVKGWIFGSVNEKVLNDLVDLGTAQEVWMKIESLMNQPRSHTEGYSSNAPDMSSLDVLAPVVYAMREDLKYIHALNANVSNFVSVKLEGKGNYHTWKNEMIHLIESHELLHIIHAEARFPCDEADPMTKKYDSLVRGWIFSTMNDNQRHRYRMYRSVQMMWRNLESAFTYHPETSNNSSDDTEDGISKSEKDMENIRLKSNVNLSNFVSVKLSDKSNYNIWRAQMLFLLESQSLLYIIIDSNFEKNIEYDNIVRDWIFYTMTEELLMNFLPEDYPVAKDFWEKLESRFTKYYPGPEPVVCASKQDLNYTDALNVNVSNFVSVKLSGHTNYGIWKAQMRYLIESQNLLHIIDNNVYCKPNKYDHLVQGWIFSTMSEQLLSTQNFMYAGYKSANIIWNELISRFDREDPREVKFGIEFINGDTELDNTDKKRWYKATTKGWWRKAKTNTNDNTLRHVAVETESSRIGLETENSRIESVKKKLYEATAEGRWRKAKSILENDKIEATEAITANGNTILHVAVEMGHNYFVEQLLKFLGNGVYVEKKNDKGRTALHIAAIVGNTHAAQLLVQKRKELLVIKDNYEYIPLHLASRNSNLNTFVYLFRRVEPSDSSIHTAWSVKSATVAAIFSKQYGE